MTSGRAGSLATAAMVLAAAGCASPGSGDTTGRGAEAASATAPSVVSPMTSVTVAAGASPTTAVTYATTATSASTTSATTASSPSTTTSTSSTSTTTTTSTSTTTTLPGPPMTSCTDVAHISDSTGVYLWEPQYVHGADNTMAERYRSVGVERWIDDSSGGRAIEERKADWQTTALEAADAIRRGGFRGCWVVMIGTNDAANIGSGASPSAEERILRMLFVFGDEPVLWVDAATARTETGYRNDNMRAWNDTLYRIAAERANVEVLRWSERVRPEWFTADGIHMGTEGRIWRAALTSAALAEFFPR